MKKIIFFAMMSACLTTQVQAEELQTEQPRATSEIPEWVKNVKFSGYGILQYQGQDKKGEKSNTFNLRLLRMILDGKIGDFDWRAQIQGTNVKGPGEPTVQLVDLYAEWVKHKEFRIKAGQFKRAFTFENPTHPITQGWYSYADVINSLSGFGDRTGEKSSGGRDIGIQVQGDLFPNADGRRLLHYQIGVYNGEGINQKDKDNRKDVIGGLWVMPVKGLRIGAFGWTGSHGDIVDYEKDENGNAILDASNKKKTFTRNLPLNRYALSAEYDLNEYTFRAEYLHSQGWGAEKTGSNVIDYSKGDKADGWYVFGIVPVVKSKLHAKARYQCYRIDKTMGHSKSMYEVGVNYFFTPKLQLNFEYARVNDRKATKHNYNFVDLELSFRF
ncbi:MAG: porin [Prevotella sp.]|nr:porin [Prevotella sp.]